jgi:hypothetical protein
MFYLVVFESGFELLGASCEAFFVAFLLANAHDKIIHIAKGLDQQQNRQRLTKSPMGLSSHLMKGDCGRNVDHKDDVDHQKKHQTDVHWHEIGFSRSKVAVDDIQSQKQFCKHKEHPIWHREEGIYDNGYSSQQRRGEAYFSSQ